MYGGYQGSYDAYGNQHYPAAAGSSAANSYQQAAAAQQPYYQGVNPYANYGYAGVAAPLPPPPPPPPGTENAYASFPTTTGTYYTPGQQIPQNSDYSNHRQEEPQPQHQGYEAAVYSFAQKSTPKPSWTHRGGHGGAGAGGYMGRYGRQGSGDNKEYYCEVCKISCAGGITYKEHLEGKGHKKREECIKAGKTAAATANLARNKLSYRCDLCNITCTGEDTYTAHVRGGKHQKTANLHKKMGKYVPEDCPTIIAPGEDGPIETKAKPKWHQQAIPGTKKVIGINTVQFVGGTKLNSTGQLENKKREVALAVGSAGKGAPTTTMTSSASAPLPEIQVDDEKIREMMEKEKVKPVGAEYVIDERDATGKLIRFICRICECDFSDPNAKDVHIKGRRHRLAYKAKIDPTLVVSPKPSNKKKRKSTTTVGSGDTMMMTSSTSSSLPLLPDGGLPRIQWFQRIIDNPTAQNSIIIDERTVEKKYESLNPGIDYVRNADCFMKELNHLFGLVSQKIGPVSSSSDEKNNEKTTMTMMTSSESMNSEAPPTSSEEDVVEKKISSEDATSPGGGGPMILISLRRAGVYAKNTYLREDECAEMVLQTHPVPEPELLAQVVDVFRVVATSGITIEQDPSSAISLIVKSSQFILPYVRIRCTSPRFLDKDELTKSTFAEKATCAEMYRQNKRLEWYQNHGEYLIACKQVIRLLRDARSRHPVWTFLDDYQIELIVHNIISSTQLTLTVLEAFKRVLEAVASGYLFNAFLMDPCETTRSNVLDTLTDQQKHDLTSSAQMFVRQIAFDQIHEVLGIDRLDEFSSSSTVPESESFQENGNNNNNVFNQEYSEGVENPEDEENPEDVNNDEEEDGDDDDDDGEPALKRGRIEEKGAEPEKGAELIKEEEPMA